MNNKNKTVTELIFEVNEVLSDMTKVYESLMFNEDELPIKHDKPELDLKHEYTPKSDDAKLVDDIEVPDDSNTAKKDGVSNDLVNSIRKMSLEGMSKLANDTEDPNYDILKKIWQFCDKKFDSKKNIDITDNF